MMLLAIIVLIINILFFGISIINAEEFDDVPEIFQVEATAYCDGEITSTGCKVRKGIVAGKKEWEGKVVAVYKSECDEIGEFIGFFEVLDCGGADIKSGKVIDIYNPSREWCLNFGRQKVFIHLIDGEG